MEEQMEGWNSWWIQVPLIHCGQMMLQASWGHIHNQTWLKTWLGPGPSLTWDSVRVQVKSYSQRTIMETRLSRDLSQDLSLILPRCLVYVTFLRSMATILTSPRTHRCSWVPQDVNSWWWQQEWHTVFTAQYIHQAGCKYICLRWLVNT